MFGQTCTSKLAWLLSMVERNANCSGLLDNFGEAQFNEDMRKD